MKGIRFALALLLLLALCFGAVGCNTDAKKTDELKLKLEDAKATETADYEATVASVEAEYEATLAELESADAEDKQALDTLKSEHSKALSEVEAEDTRIDGEITSLKAEYAEKITEAGGDPDSVLLAKPVFILTSNDTGKSLDELIAEYNEKLDKLEDDKQKNKEKKEKLIKDYEEKLEKLEAKIEKNEEDIKKCKESFEKRLADIEEKHEAKLAELDALIAELSEKTDKLAEKLEEIEGKLEAAVPEVKTHTVSFDINGGEGDFANVTVEHGEKAAKPTEKPTRAGYEFLGWYYYDAEWSFLGYSVTEDMKLVAKWETIDYTLTLKDYNEDGSDKVIGFDVESEAFTVDAPERSGYEFLGWIEDGSSSLIDTLSLAKGTVGNKSYTASWGVEVYTVTLKGCGSDGTDKILKYDVNTEIASISAPEKRGYLFTGWTEENSSVIFNTLSIPKGSSGHKIYVPHYETERYRITYIYTTGIKANPNPTSYTIESPTIQLSEPTFTNQTAMFLGWYSDFGYTKPVTEIPTGSTGNIELYARVSIDDSQWWLNITYDTTDIIMRLSENTNGGWLTSSSKRLIEGDVNYYATNIDQLIEMRNSNAYSNTKVNVTYLYWPDTEEYGYLNAVSKIAADYYGQSSSKADIYSTDAASLMCASLRGCFANLHSKQYGSGSYAGNNYFDFEEDGYLSDLTNSLSLSPTKQYVVASFYFIDVVRAFYAVPVNAYLYNMIAKDVVKDYNGDGMQSIEDLFIEVENGDWTYSKVAELSAAIYNKTNGASIGLGLFCDSLSAAGLIYTSTARTVEKSYDGTYSIPDENSALKALMAKITELFGKTGVSALYGDKYDEETGESISCVTSFSDTRKMFCENKILIGGIVTLGALEHVEYQEMKKGTRGGFGVVPVPVYKSGDPYFTTVSPLANLGAISCTTRNFVQCTAFLHYQSTNSSDILNDYYKYYLGFDALGMYEGTVKVLDYLRNYLRTSSDVMAEVASGYLFEPIYSDISWHSLLSYADFEYGNFEYEYSARVAMKKQNLKDLIKEYSKLPD